MRRLLLFKITFVLAVLLALIVATPAFSSGVVTGDGSWQWSNPTPQGNTMKSVSFIDANNGWAAGIAGTILKTTNGGASWSTEVPSITCGASPVIGSGCNLSGVSFVDANNGWAVGDYGTLWHTSNGGASWTSQTSNLPAAGCSGGGSCQSTSLSDVHFFDLNTGIATASGYAFGTTDGGVTWVLVSGVSTDYLSSVQMTDSTHAVAVGNLGTVYKISRSGGAWTAVKQTGGGIPSATDLRAVYFTDVNHGLAVGSTKLWRTVDGGANWQQNTASATTNFWGVTVVGNTFVATGDNGTILTRNSVSNWTDSMDTVIAGMNASPAASNTTSRLYAVAFPSGSSTGYAAGAGGEVIKSIDTGANWTIKAGASDKSYSGASFINDTTGWVVADNGSILKTTDAGSSWASDSSGIDPATSLQGVQFLDATTGFAVGNAGGIGVAYKYSSGTWSHMTMPAGVASLWNVHMTSATAGWAVGRVTGGAPTGVALRTADGSTWSFAGTGIGTDVELYGIDSTDAATNGWAVGQKANGDGGIGILYKYSGGTWTATEKSDVNFFTSIDMVNGSTGYAVGYFSDITGPAGKGYKTIDGGATWTAMTMNTSKLLSEVSFLDANTGFAAGEGGRVVKTINGGTTWTSESVGTSTSLSMVTVVPSTWSATGYLALTGGSNAAILRSPMPPEVASVSTSGVPVNPASNISATFDKGLNGATVTGSSFTIKRHSDSAPVAGAVSYDAGSFTATFDPSANLDYATTYDATLTTTITDSAGDHMVQAYNWSFATSRAYYWTWYDSQSAGAKDWVLMANPFGSGKTLNFSLSIAGNPMDLSQDNNGVVGPGQSIAPEYDTVIGGPVVASSLTGDKGITSQRIIWANNSLEEVLGTDAAKLSNHFWWTWYDEENGSGFKNWILIANPSDSATVYYRIKIAGASPAGSAAGQPTGTLTPGQSITPRFPGTKNGPVEVQAWSDSLDGSVPAKVMASQRVLSNANTAFNEVPGIPDSELTNHYLWTWYDNAGARDWVLVANPATNADGSLNSDAMFYEIWIGGTKQADDITGGGGYGPGTIAPGANITPRFNLPAEGPVEVKTYKDAGHTVALRSIASQRVIWGPSFEEVPGYNYSALTSDYHWTWYDQSTSSMRNWVLIANPTGSTVRAQVLIAGVPQVNTIPGDPNNGSNFFDIPTGQNVTPWFDTQIGGPVEVRGYTPGGSWPANQQNVMTSQRVLYNGFFNETLGTVLN